MLEIRTIGAGGGSIAKVGDGRLSVGPHSAGAVPGPVCYSRGGTLPTVTDANTVLGRLDAGSFLGSAMTLDVGAARQAVETSVATPLNLSVEAAAEGILAVTNVSLAAAIRLSLFEKGLDPKDFALLSFGGAGGLHAIEVAEELGIEEVVFPPDASTFSAYGILNSDIVHDLARSRVLPATIASLPLIIESCSALRAQGQALLDQDGVPSDRRELILSADLRYHGQAFELVIPWGDVAPGVETLARLVSDFHAMHRKRFSYANEGDPVELVTLRLAAIGRLPRRDAVTGARTPAQVAPTMRRIHLGQGWTEIPVHDRDSLVDIINGPALIQEPYTSSYIAPGWRCGPNQHGDLMARKALP
jgi:N-methylhydantoinase A